MHQEFIKYVKTYKPGQFLIKEGEQDGSFFCLVQGTVSIWKGPPEQKDKMIKVGVISDKGTYFGEMSPLLGESRTASIIATDQVKVLKFPGEMLPQMIVKQPKLGLKLCTALADRLRGTTTQQVQTSEHRNQLRDDATSQDLHAREQFQKLFVMLTAVQQNIQQPLLKSVVEYMSTDKLLQGGRKLRIDDRFLETIPELLKEPICKAYPQRVVK
ncbi:MAG: cyclic nucleotide-binding domain-containing protein [Chlamydiia bacterium]|nr:cyclic nucleotide-binding domain-containing protein [Chlamydiia bacterium]